MMIQVILASIAVLQILVGGVGILGATATAAAGRRGGATVAATRRLVTLTGGIRDTAIHAGRGIAIPPGQTLLSPSSMFACCCFY